MIRFTSAGRRILMLVVTLGAIAAADSVSIVEAQAWPLEAKGCYFHRGHRYCGRYCYWEADGRRYCRERFDEAYPQGGYYLYDHMPVDRRHLGRRRVYLH